MGAPRFGRSDYCLLYFLPAWKEWNSLPKISTNESIWYLVYWMYGARDRKSWSIWIQNHVIIQGKLLAFLPTNFISFTDTISKRNPLTQEKIFTNSFRLHTFTYSMGPEIGVLKSHRLRKCPRFWKFANFQCCLTWQSEQITTWTLCCKI